MPRRLLTTADEAAAVRAAGALAGRREAALLSEPSVVRTATLLAARCPSAAWVRAAVATLDRFAHTVAAGDLGQFLAAARADPRRAEAGLLQFADALDGCADTQLAALAFGPKVWLATNGVRIPWRPLPARRVSATRWTAGGATARDRPDERGARLLLLLLIGSGLAADEAARLRLGDLGCLDEDGGLVPDLAAEPLAAQYTPAEGGSFGGAGSALTFLSFEAREALQVDLLRRTAAGEPIDASVPVLGTQDPTAVIAEARARHAALIEAGNDVNVATCRVTGDFFRAWGMPGAAFDDALPTKPETQEDVE